MTEDYVETVVDLLPIGDRLDVLIVRAEETLEVLGNIQGLMTFFAIVLLCFFVYKFFRMFF